MKIYTKTGDKGDTSLVGGQRVPKYHIRIEAYGTIDELIAYIGMIRDVEQNKQLTEKLIFVQDRLMVCASVLATPEGVRLPVTKAIIPSDIAFLEDEIDKMDEVLPPLKSFILPGGHISVSFCHIARTVCRRAERKTVELASNEKIDVLTLKFLNRLSDYLFTLSRSLSKKNKALEVPWNPQL